MPFDNKLKSVSVRQLEAAIAKAMNELIGQPYECSISKLSFGQLGASASIEAVISEPLSSGLFDKAEKVLSES